MTVSGYLLLAARSVVAALEDQCSGADAQCSSYDSSHTMAYQHDVTCHCKLALYAAGLVAGGAVIGYIVGTKLAQKKARCNQHVKLDTDKVVDTVDIEEIGEQKVYCRCWKSKKFPYCDGSHNAHNKETGDNVGPLIVKGKPATSATS